MKERINQIMQTEGLNASQFAESIGIQRAAMSHIMSGRNNPSLDVVTKILERFPNLNPDWLLFGNGTMSRGTVVAASNDIHSDDLNLFAERVIDSATSANNELFKTTDISYRQKTSHETQQTPSKIVFDEEKNKGVEFDKKLLNAQMEEKDAIINKIAEARKIEKIVVFYSDNTYETFEGKK